MEYPSCQSQAFVKNGSIHNGKQKYACKDCDRQFIENPQNSNQPIAQETTAILHHTKMLNRLSMLVLASKTSARGVIQLPD